MISCANKGVLVYIIWKNHKGSEHDNEGYKLLGNWFNISQLKSEWSLNPWFGTASQVIKWAYNPPVYNKRIEPAQKYNWEYLWVKTLVIWINVGYNCNCNC